MPNARLIRSAHSTAQDARLAVREFHAGVIQPDTALVIFFCTSQYDLDALADEMNACFAGVPVVGCTTAGEIGPAGYRDHSLSGISFPAESFAVVTGFFDNLQRFNVYEGQAHAHALLQQLEAGTPNANSGNSFAFMMIDGLSVREEPVGWTLHNALGKIPLVGGSAGDDVQFSRTWVFHDGAFHNDSAVLVLVSTPFPFRTFKTQHFVSLDERLVVTEADPEHRIVKEINGRPAAEEYARVIGVPTSDLGTMRFASSPVVVVIDGTDYVRSIQKANPDGSLTFFCAIEEGLVFRVAKGVDLIKGMESTFKTLEDDIGPPQAILVCDCILRNLEVTQKAQKPEVSEIFQKHLAVGFSTYGEQFGGVHVNQTLTGIAIGKGDAGDA